MPHNPKENVLKKLLIATAAVLALASPALAADYPKAMQGAWCESADDGSDYELCKGEDKTPVFRVVGDLFLQPVDFGCKLLSVAPRRLRRPPADKYTALVAREDCDGKITRVQYTFFAFTYPDDPKPDPRIDMKVLSGDKYHRSSRGL